MSRKVITLVEFIKKVKEIHKDKFDYSKIKYINTLTKIEIICKKCGKSFWQTPKNHLNGRGCPYCAGKYKNTEQIIKEFQQVHSKSKYNYDKVDYKNYKTKVKIFCNKCKKYFFQSPDAHLHGHGCPYCANSKKHQKQRSNKNEFIKKAHAIHGKNHYDYSQVEYNNIHSKVKIFCNKCKKYFWQDAASHLLGCGCKNCQYNKIRQLKSFSKEEFEKISKKIHGNKYDYSEVNYINIKTKVKIYCNKCQKYFYQRPEDHLKGCGCPSCVKISHGEKFIKIFLKTNNIKFKSQKRFKDCRDKLPLPFDFYLPEYNICIEYQGEQHYNSKMFILLYKSKEKGIEYFKKQQLHDQIKRDYCKKNNILLIEIKYNDNIEEELNKIMKGKICQKPIKDI